MTNWRPVSASLSRISICLAVSSLPAYDLMWLPGVLGSFGPTNTVPAFAMPSVSRASVMLRSVVPPPVANRSSPATRPSPIGVFVSGAPKSTLAGSRMSVFACASG